MPSNAALVFKCQKLQAKLKERNAITDKALAEQWKEIVELRKENLKLAESMAKLISQKSDLEHRISSLEDALDDDGMGRDIDNDGMD